MTKTMIRLASEQDAEKLQQLMHEAFTPLRELGIDWPSVNANLDAVKENIDKNTTFVMTIDDEIISTITVRYPWGSVKSISGASAMQLFPSSINASAFAKSPA